jgi:hypothetical protein
MEEIRQIQKLIRGNEKAEDGQEYVASCALDASIEEMLHNAEEKSYDKLVT